MHAASGYHIFMDRDVYSAPPAARSHLLSWAFIKSWLTDKISHNKNGNIILREDRFFIWDGNAIRLIVAAGIAGNAEYKFN